MKKLFSLLALISFAFLSMGQPGQWVWLHGDTVSGSFGNFGTQGVSSPTNVPPGLYEACEWRDNQGNLWIFGGRSAAGGNNSDVWKFDIALNEWTWMKGPGISGSFGNYGIQGVSSPLNEPPARDFGYLSWTDLQGDFWFFGGYNFSDLWRYQVSTNEWTWMKGPNIQGQLGIYGVQGVPDPANNPGNRCETSVSWTANNGDLWLFGGYPGYSDLWSYNIASNQWTWMKGPQTTLDPGVYGTKGVEDPLNNPSGRMTYSHWKASNGNLWFYGGYDNAANFYNDVWRYNMTTNNWTWMNGSNLPNSPGNHGSRCIPDSSNTPDMRFETRASVTDQYGNFWLFGGGSPSSFTSTYNDVWLYCAVLNMWVWISGDSLANPVGNWGTKGVSSPANRPNGRAGNVGISDLNGSLYFFGGTSTTFPNFHNDVWKYTIDYSCGGCTIIPIALFTAPHHICPGTCTEFNNNSINATTYEWIFPGGTPATTTDEEPQVCYLTPGVYDVTLIASNPFGSDTLTLTNYVTVFPYSPSQSINQSGDTLISNTGFVAYQWFFDGDTIPGATNYFYVALQSGNYSVVCIDNNGCNVEAVILNVIAELNETENGNTITFYPSPADQFLIIESASGRIGRDAIVYNIFGEKVFTGSTQTLNMSIGERQRMLDISSLASGIYYLEIIDGQKALRAKFMKK